MHALLAEVGGYIRKMQNINNDIKSISIILVTPFHAFVTLSLELVSTVAWPTLNKEYTCTQDLYPGVSYLATED